MNDLNYSELSEAEKELIFSKEMSMNKVGRTLKENVQKYIDAIRDKNLVKAEE